MKFISKIKNLLKKKKTPTNQTKKTNTKNEHLDIKINSENNQILVNSNKNHKGSIKVEGDNNKIEIPDTTSFNLNIHIKGTGNKIIIGENCKLSGQILIKGRNQSVSIGEYTTFGSVYILCQENSNVSIGKYCMFSREIEIRTTDAHSVIDNKTNIRLNKPGDVFISDHVWISLRCLINKNTRIPKDCIVGAYSFVNKNFSDADENSLIAGTPAKVLKRNVTWNRERKNKFPQAELDYWK